MPSLLTEVTSNIREQWRPAKRLHLDEWADAHYVLPEGDANAGRWRTLPYQRGIMQAISDTSIERVSLMKSSRTGYALALATPIPTPNGWATMGTLQVGDQALDDQGRPCVVTVKSPVYLGHPCYRVTFCDGSSIVADEDHLWAVETNRSLEYLSGERGVGRIGRPKPGQVATFEGIIHTVGLAVMYRSRLGEKTIAAVRNAAPLDLPRVDLPIPPYTLGLWLGDGSRETPRITQHRPDVAETASYIAEEGIRPSIRYIDSRYPDNATIFLDVPDEGTPVSPWRAAFRLLGLTVEKHVPPVYLRSSQEQRLALLRGLMDSDGTIDKSRGFAEFSNTNERLSRGVYELVVSLGMKAHLAHRKPPRARTLPQLRVLFRAHPEMNPFRLRRKAARVRARTKPSINTRRRIVKLNRVRSVPVQCIGVDSPSHLYLAGEQMVPTHNTKGCICATVGYFIAEDPCPILLVQPTIDDAKKHSKEDIATLLHDVVVLRGLVSEAKSRDGSNTLTEKFFRGGSLSLVGANSPRGFRRTSRRVVIFDEVDGYPASAGTEGDPIELGIRRSEYYWNRKILAGSTPTLAGHSRIADLFEDGDQRRYYVPCPHCGTFQVLKFPNLKWPDGQPERAHFVCEAHGCVMEPKDKRGMVEAGEWRAEAPEHFTPEHRHASFHIWAAYSYSPNATWGQLVAEFVKANRGGALMLQTFVNTVLGETFTVRGEAPAWEPLYRRREAYRIGTVPRGALLLTAGVDVQKDRLVYVVLGWGRGKTSWVVDTDTLIGETADMTHGPWPQLDALLARTFPHEGGVPMMIRMLAVDSGYNTQQVYGWARQHPMSRVIAIKGGPSGGQLIGAPSPVELSDRGRKLKRGYRVWPVSGHIAKGELYGWLRLEAPTDGSAPPPGFVHFPQVDEEFFRQLTAEQLIPVKTARGFVRLEWSLIPGRQNHILDGFVYARAAAAVCGLDRFSESDWAALERATGQETAVAPGATAPMAQSPSPPMPPPRKAPWLGPQRGWLARR